MKPNSTIHRTPRHRDVCAGSSRCLGSLTTDYHFQPPTDFSSSCRGSNSPSFRKISADYFKHEARGHFASEAALFSLIIFTVAIPVIEGIRGVAEIAQSLL